MPLRRLVLEVEPEDEPITGVLHDAERDDARPFTGWLGLIAAIEALAHAEAGPDRDEKPSAGSSSADPAGCGTQLNDR